MRILVVEDEAVLASALVEALEREAYAVDLAVCGEEARELVAVNPYDLIILDWSIPPPSGIELLEAWRRQDLATPVMMLTGRSSLADRIDGLDRGADDYLTKPFEIGELLARTRCLLRRSDRDLAPALVAGDVAMDRASRQVTVNGEPVMLRPKEFALLEYLLRHLDQVVRRGDLVEHVWDDSFDSFSNVVDVTVHRVRKAIDRGREGSHLHTVKGVGYLLRSRRS